MKFLIFLCLFLGLGINCLGEPEHHLKDIKSKRIEATYLSTLKDHELREFLVNRIHHLIDEASPNFKEGEKIVLKKLSQTLKTFYFFNIIDVNIGNGGLEGYFGIGEEPKFFDETMKACETLKLNKLIEILKKAKKIHERENKKFFDAVKIGKENEFFENYEFSAFEELEKELGQLNWDFEKEIDRFLRKNFDDLKE